MTYIYSVSLTIICIILIIQRIVIKKNELAIISNERKIDNQCSCTDYCSNQANRQSDEINQLFKDYDLLLDYLDLEKIYIRGYTTLIQKEEEK